ncbi:MAG: Txe/YoeB family addiction module toxin [Tannerellaceae bacterium]|nr:Txe/YoeB family addiction module toxin [Tannerellaceae bacterium]
MSYLVQFTDEALAHLNEHAKTGDKSILKKIVSLIKELEEHPTTGTGKPEMLRYNLKGYWSRRITQKHRLIYQIKDEEIIVIIISAIGHYDNK